MPRKIEVDLNEVRRVFKLLEEVNGLLHQPLRYRDPEQVERFAEKFQSQISDAYYKVVWNWLPQDVQQEIDNE